MLCLQPSLAMNPVKLQVGEVGWKTGNQIWLHLGCIMDCHVTLSKSLPIPGQCFSLLLDWELGLDDMVVLRLSCPIRTSVEL